MNMEMCHGTEGVKMMKMESTKLKAEKKSEIRGYITPPLATPPSPPPPSLLQQ
ncbi:hypothetical protein E2C01_053929 [Portunus trituberculatus]|uniref:Uncharacterized protein n=1 Tax=Portunus trituberculatus TaxID=210409 RepID=A0A5B7GHZ3_PORTR|nr:hypothetical protein [Portunus trituberculatus]